MGLSSAEQLGRLIAGGLNETTQLKEDVFPSDVDQSLLLNPFEKVQVRLQLVANNLIYPSTSFILDHPTYGELDSSTLQLDGGYASSTTSTFTYSS